MARITGEFARVYGGRRTDRNTHDFATGFTEAINENPSDATRWLILADRLADLDNPAHIMIRAMFDPTFTAPEGFTGAIERGFRYFENGEQYWKGVNVRFDGKKFTRHGWANGAYSEEVSREEAVATIIRQAGTSLGLIVTGALQS